MLIVIAGLGLEGGSMAKALKRHTDHTVFGWNRTLSVAEQALADGAIDGIADETVLSRCDLLIPVLYPRATIDYLRRAIPLMKRGAQVVDLVGVKTAVVEAVTPLALAHGVRYTGGHPMAGLAKAGSGDVLAGVVGALAAQGHEPAVAAACGVWLHGMAGDYAANEFSQYGMLPRDVIRMLPRVFADHGR